MALDLSAQGGVQSSLNEGVTFGYRIEDGGPDALLTAALDLKVSNLRPEHIDPDLLDEQVRATLNLVPPNETVIMQPANR